MAYTVDELEVMSQHIQNALAVLFQGKQALCNYLGNFMQEDRCKAPEVTTIFYLIAILDNLKEALNTLQLDANYMLHEQHVN